ncbi:hypothetical protein LXP99_15515 [Clostridium perfringens]|nr:hypothetical protein [Clostridium perfringens]MCG4561066.1 hypothetical protein [Clostridium perfringens]
MYTIDKATKIVEIYSCWAHYESGALEMSGKSNSQKTSDLICVINYNIKINNPQCLHYRYWGLFFQCFRGVIL